MPGVCRRVKVPICLKGLAGSLTCESVFVDVSKYSDVWKI